MLAFPEAQKLLDEEGNAVVDAEAWAGRAKRCFDQLHWILEACKSHKKVSATPQ